MRRSSIIGAASVAALAAGALAVSGGAGSSHREAPSILGDPTADNTDLYAFTAPDAPKHLTIVSNWIPFEDPSGGPYFGKLDPKARYYVKIDNTGDGREDVAYRWDFDQTFRKPGSFLYARPTVDTVDDPDLNFVQTYDLYRETYKNGNKREKQLANDLPVAPDNVGPKTMPNYANVSAGAVRNLRGGYKSFVGPADDAFFIDLATVFDGINIDKPGRPGIGFGNQGGGKDDVAGYNTHSFVLQIPESAVTKNGRGVTGAAANNAPVGVWSTTERKRVSVVRHRGKRRVRTDWVQVSRVGNPLINEIVIPIGKKDKYNATSPADDNANFGAFALAPEPAKLLNELFGLGVKETDRTDIVQALLTGIPNLTQIGGNPAAADTLKVNLGVPPSATPNRFGLLAKDAAGFPNGRRLADDVVDIELRVVAGALLKPDETAPLGDGVDQNDKPFRSTFPYVALPDSGFDSKLKRIEPPHAPVPQPPA